MEESNPETVPVPNLENDNQPSTDTMEKPAVAVPQDQPSKEEGDQTEKLVESQPSSKEPSSEPQFKDAEKGAEEEEQQYEDEDGSEYEDLDDEDVDDNNHVSVTVDSSTKTPLDDQDVPISVKPRRIQKKQDDDEENTTVETLEQEVDSLQLTEKTEPKSEKNAEQIDADNDPRNEAYVPRKGRFYEHDDRTNDDTESEKKDTPKSKGRAQNFSDAKWQHDLYDEDDEPPKGRYPPYEGRGGRRGRGRSNRGGGGGGAHNNRDQLHIDDYIPPGQRGNSGKGRHELHEQYQDEEGYDPRRRPLPNHRGRGGGRHNNFDVEDYNRPSSNNRGRGTRSNFGDSQGQQRRQRPNFDQYQNDEPFVDPRSDTSFQRERNFTNTHFQQQQRSAPKMSNRGDEQYRQPSSSMYFEAPTDPEKSNRGEKPRSQHNEKANEDQGRRHPSTNQNNRNQARPHGGGHSEPGSNLSADAPSFERPKRYSNMRNNPTNSAPQQQQHHQQQQQPQHQQHQQHQQQQPQHQQHIHHHQQPPVPMQSYPDQRPSYNDQSRWQPLPSNPQNFMPQHNQAMMHSQIYRPPPPIPSQNYFARPAYQGVSGYSASHFSQGAMGQQMQDNK